MAPMKTTPAELTERHLRVEAVPAAQRNRVLAELSGLPGMELADLTGDGAVLFLRYDASRLTFEGIEQALADAQVRLPADWQSRLHTAWCEFSDRNVHDHAQHEPSCCGKPPRGG
ncbi:MAG: hypothetical protein HYV16_01980 [Gammaproteobacteria bacterium]|nr:hypothetical protein [Gammaproteobacteria bacterium]